jgi:hypothetical protein
MQSPLRADAPQAVRPVTGVRETVGSDSEDGVQNVKRGIGRAMRVVRLVLDHGGSGAGRLNECDHDRRAAVESLLGRGRVDFRWLPIVGSNGAFRSARAPVDCEHARAGNIGMAAGHRAEHQRRAKGKNEENAEERDRGECGKEPLAWKCQSRHLRVVDHRSYRSSIVVMKPPVRTVAHRLW